MSDETVDNSVTEALVEDPFADLEANLKSEKPQAEATAPKIPEKYMNKSAEELIEMHRNLETTLGKQSNELGELRKQSELLMQIAARQNSAVPEPAKAVEDEDIDESVWYSNPAKAVEKIVNKRMAGIEAELVRERREKAVQYITGKHPDAEKIAADPQFHAFVAEHPIRQQILQRVRTEGDVNSLDYLLTEFKGKKGTVKKEETQIKQDVSHAIGETGSAAVGTHKQTIRRSQIQALRASNPRRYEELMPLIRDAYQEGRVVNDLK
jgi:hypothetical protein